MRVSIKLPTGIVITDEFKASSITIGRSNTCDLPCANDSLSRTHAKVEIIDGEFLITDLGSSNGVYLDGDRIPPQIQTKFNSYQQLTLASLECQIEDTSDEPAPIIKSNRKVEVDDNEVTKVRKFVRPTPTLTKKRPPKKVVATKTKEFGKMAPFLIFTLVTGIYFYFKPIDAKSGVEKSPDNLLVQSNVPEVFRDVKDDFVHDYMVVNADKGCEKDFEICNEMKLSHANGEGIVRKGKEIFVFIVPAVHLNDMQFDKIKEHSESSEFVSLYLLFGSSLMKEFDKKIIGQVHLIILDKDLNQTKAFRFHPKYYAGNEVIRMLTDLGDVVENGSKADTFWSYSEPLIKTKIL